MEDVLFKLGVFVIGLPSLYFLLRAKTFFRRLALLATIAGGVAVGLLVSGKEDTGMILLFGEWLAWVGIIGFVFLIISVILDWLLSGE